MFKKERKISTWVKQNEYGQENCITILTQSGHSFTVVKASPLTMASRHVTNLCALSGFKDLCAVQHVGAPRYVRKDLLATTQFLHRYNTLVILLVYMPTSDVLLCGKCFSLYPNRGTWG